MSILTFFFLLLCVAFVAGLIGSLTGLGGGVVIIPALILFFHINIHYAMGASLVSVIATSSGAGAAYLREGYANLRIGMFLEVSAVIGAFIGALLIAVVSKFLLTIIFCAVLFFSAYLTLKRNEDSETNIPSHPWATTLKLNGTYTSKNLPKHYNVQNVPQAFFLMGIAGVMSGLLGIGSGSLKVLAMDQMLKLPYKVATATSNFMIGITGAVSAGLYFYHGYINPIITLPVMLGVLLGSLSGARILSKVNQQTLRIIFCIVICLMAIQMLLQTFGFFFLR